MRRRGGSEGGGRTAERARRAGPLPPKSTTAIRPQHARCTHLFQRGVVKVVVEDAGVPGKEGRKTRDEERARAGWRRRRRRPPRRRVAGSSHPRRRLTAVREQVAVALGQVAGGEGPVVERGACGERGAERQREEGWAAPAWDAHSPAAPRPAPLPTPLLATTACAPVSWFSRKVTAREGHSPSTPGGRPCGAAGARAGAAGQPCRDADRQAASQPAHAGNTPIITGTNKPIDRPHLRVNEAPVLLARHRLLQHAPAAARGARAGGGTRGAGGSADTRPGPARAQVAAPARTGAARRPHPQPAPSTHLEREVKGGGGAARGVAPVHGALPVPRPGCTTARRLHQAGRVPTGGGQRSQAEGHRPPARPGQRATPGHPAPPPRPAPPTHPCRSRCPSTRQTPSVAPWHPHTRPPTAPRTCGVCVGWGVCGGGGCVGVWGGAVGGIEGAGWAGGGRAGGGRRAPNNRPATHPHPRPQAHPLT